MRTFDELRLLGDQVLVRCLGTADMQGSIHIPASAQEGRKIHQSGGDYLHRGEVVMVGPGDRLISLNCIACKACQYRLETAKYWKCDRCGGDLQGVRSQSEEVFHKADVSRAEMPVSVGDIVLYENRRDAKLQPRRFPSLGLDEDTYVILLAEQHVLAVIE